MVEEVCGSLNDKRSEHAKVKENNIGREGNGTKTIRLEGSSLLALEHWEVVARCMARSLQRSSRYTS